MSKACECGGSTKRGILGRECIACGAVVDGERTPAPCANGELVAGVNRCVSSRIAPAVAGSVYYHLACNHSCTMDGQCPGFCANTEYKVEGLADKTAANGQWCLYLDHAGNCVQPIYDIDPDGDIKQDTLRNENIGRCPYKSTLFHDGTREQKNCSIARPDPSWPVSNWSAYDESMKGFSKSSALVIGHWNDVRQKAVQMRRDGRVKLLRNDKSVIAAEVKGEHGTYEVVLNRQSADSWAISTWSCECGWGQWAFKRQHTYVGRMCSHAYAALMAAQAEKMQGDGSNLYQHMYASNDEGCTYCGSNAEVVIEAESSEPICEPCLASMAEVACRDALTEKMNGAGFEFLEANFGKEATFNMLVDFVDEPSDISVGSRQGRLLFFDNSGRYAQVEFDDGAKELVSVSEVSKDAQSISTSFRDRVLTSLKMVMGENPVDNLVVRFSDHWSRRVTGDFQSAGVQYSYEYTQSTGRVSIKEIANRVYSQPEVEPYTKHATRFHTHTEQTELQQESIGAHARNFDRLVTDGSHYRVEDISDAEDVDDISRIFS